MEYQKLEANVQKMELGLGYAGPRSYMYYTERNFKPITSIIGNTHLHEEVVLCTFGGMLAYFLQLGAVGMCLHCNGLIDTMLAQDWKGSDPSMPTSRIFEKQRGDLALQDKDKLGPVRR